jgi:hypothetical protein
LPPGRSRLGGRCKTLPSFKADPIYCAIGAYRGSWERPDTGFAEAVKATVANGNAPNFDMPKDAYFDSTDIASDPPAPGPRATLTAPPTASDDVGGWSSALFPAKPSKSEGASADVQNRGRSAQESPLADPSIATPTTTKSPAGSLFVPRSSERRP